MPRLILIDAPFSPRLSRYKLLEARDEKRLLRLQRQLAAYKLLVIDELGYVPLSQTGAELLFEVFSQRYERGSTIVTSSSKVEPSRTCMRSNSGGTPLKRPTLRLVKHLG